METRTTALGLSPPTRQTMPNTGPSDGVQVFAAEHFAEVVQPWTCSAAPVHEPATGRVLGVIDLTSRLSEAHPHCLTVATVTAAAVEAELRSRLHSVKPVCAPDTSSG